MNEKAIELAQALDILKRREAGRKLSRMFPDDGPFSRFNYPQQMHFFELGSEKRFRCFIGGNGTGKSVAGAYEMALHLTGRYPGWWTGKRFPRAITAWAAGTDFKEIRESIQEVLLGPNGQEGTGMIPQEDIIKAVYRSSPAGSLDYVQVQHVSGGISKMVVKSYVEGREGFQAANVDFIWLDEEPSDAQIYSECVQRFRGDTKEGQLILTFTPLFGISDVVLMFIPEYMESFNSAIYELSSRAYVYCTWDDVPHISSDERKLKSANMMEYEKEARQNGRPAVGQGRVFPFEESSFVIDPLREGIPKHWLRMYGFDPGLTIGAAVWGARDPDTDILYLYSEHYMKNQLPPVHSTAIKARGVWIPGVVDWAGRSVETGINTMKLYSNQGLRLKEADKTNKRDGIFDVYERIATGRLKVMRNLVNWLREFRQYSRDKHNEIIKKDDHLMDATRYLVRDLQMAVPFHETTWTKPQKAPEETFGIYG